MTSPNAGNLGQHIPGSTGFQMTQDVALSPNCQTMAPALAQVTPSDSQQIAEQMRPVIPSATVAGSSNQPGFIMQPYRPKTRLEVHEKVQVIMDSETFGYSQRQLSKKFCISLGSVNRILKSKDQILTEHHVTKQYQSLSKCMHQWVRSQIQSGQVPTVAQVQEKASQMAQLLRMDPGVPKASWVQALLTKFSPEQLQPNKRSQIQGNRAFVTQITGGVSQHNLTPGVLSGIQANSALMAQTSVSTGHGLHFASPTQRHMNHAHFMPRANQNFNKTPNVNSLKAAVPNHATQLIRAPVVDLCDDEPIVIKIETEDDSLTTSNHSSDDHAEHSKTNSQHIKNDHKSKSEKQSTEKQCRSASESPVIQTESVTSFSEHACDERNLEFDYDRTHTSLKNSDTSNKQDVKTPDTQSWKRPAQDWAMIENKIKRLKEDLLGPRTQSNVCDSQTTNSDSAADMDSLDEKDEINPSPHPVEQSSDSKAVQKPDKQSKEIIIQNAQTEFNKADINQHSEAQVNEAEKLGNSQSSDAKLQESTEVQHPEAQISKSKKIPHPKRQFSKFKQVRQSEEQLKETEFQYPQTEFPEACEVQHPEALFTGIKKVQHVDEAQFKNKVPQRRDFEHAPSSDDDDDNSESGHHTPSTPNFYVSNTSSPCISGTSLPHGFTSQQTNAAPKTNNETEPLIFPDMLENVNQTALTAITSKLYHIQQRLHNLGEPAGNLMLLIAIQNQVQSLDSLVLCLEEMSKSEQSETPVEHRLNKIEEKLGTLDSIWNAVRELKSENNRR